MFWVVVGDIAEKLFDIGVDVEVFVILRVVPIPSLGGVHLAVHHAHIVSLLEVI